MVEKSKFTIQDRCADCKFFDTVVNIETKQQVTLCRKKTPASTAQLLMMPGTTQVTPQNPQGVSPQWSTFTLWPVVGGNDWCGEFVRNIKGEAN
jgi:hypothetical protein